ncbi:MAG: ankyrin repeat domain-containing protein, partial [Rhodobacteraceae bacterium]|nr:ankyrin repeat domain-containing protein [Paracoccaceae bacterium]
TESDGFTLLHAAVEVGSIENIKVLLDPGLDPNAQTLFGYTALHTAASDRSDEIVLLLIDNGADPAIDDDSGRTPFDHASANKKLSEKTLLKLFKAVQE